ncbi:hypothetical protein HDK77DRAFT_431255 [Phyllosticta capitalensis]
MSSSEFNLNPLAMPFVPAQQDEDHVASPTADTQRQSSAGRNYEAENCRYIPYEGVWPSSDALEPFPYYVDPISGIAYISDPPAPRREDAENATPLVDICNVLRLPLNLKLVLVYKITSVKPYRVQTTTLPVLSDSSPFDIEGKVFEIIREDMKEAIKKDEIPFKDRNAFGCGRVDFKAKVLKQGADPRLPIHISYLDPNAKLWYALRPEIREKLARGEEVEDREVTLRVTVTVFEGFPIRRLFGYNA